jgi:hypothetical protein
MVLYEAGSLTGTGRRFGQRGSQLLVSLIREFQHDDRLRLRWSGFKPPLLHGLNRVFFKDRISSDQAGCLYGSASCDNDFQLDFASQVDPLGKLGIGWSGFGNHFPRGLLRC